MATFLEQADAGDQFITKLEQARARLQDMVTFASNTDLFPAASNNAVNQINMAYDALGRAFDQMAIHTYKARRAANGT